MATRASSRACQRQRPRAAEVLGAADAEGEPEERGAARAGGGGGGSGGEAVWAADGADLSRSEHADADGPTGPEPAPADAAGPTGPELAPEPRLRLDRAARTVWRLAAVTWTVPLAIAILWLTEREQLPGPRAGWVLLVAVVLLLFVGLVPELRWRRWRYEIRPHEIDIRRGLVTVTRTLVPMGRVQHVDTDRGPLQQLKGLATVTFHTAAGENEIPNLARAEADRVRTRIAELTRVPDEL